tara:strand:- start:1858 stop:3015 length:1158 start_codon:yes stop_codon:yes gene_type:complete
MTQTDDDRTMTVPELLAMAKEIVDADGELHEAEEDRLATLEEEYSEDAVVSFAEARSILRRVAGVDGEDDAHEHMLIKELLDAHAGTAKESVSEDEAEQVDDAHSAASSEPPSAEEPFDPTANLPDSTRDLEIDGEAHMWIRDLDLRYGNAQAIYNVSIPIERNAVTALIGPSGCGKSTLLRCLNRMNDLIPICKVEGDIDLEDTRISGSSADLVSIRRRVGMVFQKPNPFPKSIYDNVAYGVRLHYNPSRRELDRIVEAALRRAAIWDEVSDRLHEMGTSLSGGQQQRLCIARTIAVEPEVILMDEPCSALDPIATAKIEELILELKEHFTVVIVTHSMSQAQRVSDYTGFMYLGRMVEFGKTKQIFSDPREELTGRYISGRFG